MRQISWVLVSFIVVAGASFSPESGAQSGGDWAREAGAGTILRVDPRFDALVPADARIEKIADGFVFIEGPIWLRDEGRLLFSDVRGNAIYQWSEADGVSPFIDPVYDGLIAGMRTVGSNGLTLDTEGRLIICEHSGRMISRLESDGTRTTLVDHYNGHRLNSPNDVVYSSDGWMYFTDPSYGLEGLEDSPLRELDFNGVYRLSPSGELELLTRDQTRPNGIALSPDESTLYVANSDPEKALWMAYDIGPHGVSNPRVFYDVTDEEGEVGADGLKVDNAGNLFATGAGRVWIFSPDGTHLGTIRPDESPANVGWGDDGSTLYMTARTGLYRIRLSTAGAMP